MSRLCGPGVTFRSERELETHRHRDITKEVQSDHGDNWEETHKEERSGSSGGTFRGFFLCWP